MIKIINGIYGYKQGNSIIPKTKKDEPFECDKAEEARLVKLGVAEYVGETKTEEDAPLYTDATGLAELKEIAKSLGATDEELKPIKSKAAAKELIDKLAAGAEQTETEEVEEDAPKFDEVDGVV
jgi:hypothetical protein